MWVNEESEWSVKWRLLWEPVKAISISVTSHLVHVILHVHTCIVRLFRGRKLLWISWFCGYLRFLCKIWGQCIRWRGKREQKFSLQKLYFPPICKSFLPRKFPAIRYLRWSTFWMHSTSHEATSTCTCTKMVQQLEAVCTTRTVPTVKTVHNHQQVPTLEN